MSVETFTGDLLDFPAGINVIAHCANCRNTMTTGASGIARAIAERYPAAAEADNEAFTAGLAQLGLLSKADVGPGKVVQLYGQAAYGNDRRHLDYEAFYVALETLRDLLQDAHAQGRVYTLGLPYKIGCDRAKGSWTVISAMIHSLFDESPIRCVIVQLPTIAT